MKDWGMKTPCLWDSWTASDKSQEPKFRVFWFPRDGRRAKIETVSDGKGIVKIEVEDKQKAIRFSWIFQSRCWWDCETLGWRSTQVTTQKCCCCCGWWCDSCCYRLFVVNIVIVAFIDKVSALPLTCNEPPERIVSSLCLYNEISESML